MKNYFTTHKSPLTVLLFMLIAGGLFAYTKLQTSLFPEITFPKIKIIADAGLQPVDKMMVTVTRPLENAIKQVPELVDIRSSTSRGSCEISAYMAWKANIDLSQQQIEARIAEIRNSLPAEVNITVEKMNPSILPVMGYSVESHELSPIELKELAIYTIKPYLSQVPGVSEIRITGGKSKEFRVNLNLQKMSTLSVTPDAINTALAQTNFIKSNGYLSDYNYLYLTVTDASVQSLDELKSVVVSNNSKRIVKLQDIADVQISEAVEYIKINANGKEGLLLGVIKQPNSNLVDVSKQMEDKIRQLRKILPKDVTIKPYYIQADFVNESVKSVTDSLWIGLALAIIVAMIFLRSFKASATILITIPITLGTTLIALYGVGYTLNIMTLGAIAAAIGLIIDDAIVVVEQIHRTHEENPGDEYKNIVHNAIKYLFPAMVGSSLSTIVIFIPFMLMSGVAGAYFNVLTNTMIITLVCSFFVTWIGLPVVYLWFSRKKKSFDKLRIKEEEQHTVKKQQWVSWFIMRPWISFILVAGLIAAIVLILPQLQTGFLPEMDEGSIVMDYASIPGTSLTETDKELRTIEKIIIADPEVEAYSRRTGTQMGFFITEPNTGDYLIQLKKNRKKTTDQVIEELRKQIESSQPALRVDFGQVIADMLGDLMTSVQPIEIKIFGNDKQKLHELARQVNKVVKDTKGTADAFDGIVIAGPSISVNPDYTKLSQFGITPANLQYQVQASLEGNLIGSIYDKDRVYPVRLVYPGSRQMSVDDLKKLQIFLPGGGLKSISELATIEVNQGDAEIQRENLQSMGVVTARLENRDLGSTIKDIKANINKQVHLPQGYTIEYGGEYEQQQKSFSELLLILISSSILVFGVILFLFKSIKTALAILVIAVLGIAGSYIALFITHTPLNVGSYTGLIMIVGIIGENSIFTYLQFKETLPEKSVDDSIVYAISTRLRPKLMTALGAIIALMPLALGIGAGAQLHQPLAIAVIGGFLIALPLLLIVLPSMLRLLYKNYQHKT
ncbi:efflux RND transporter permease subunit [Ginsengibacter hankyongi]|uniref:Efflux RND transporter permease subunit n=1 Tax=Ginsengibacter hankyongi TaxID=2607284 RepID=A0A5J5IHP7_9BACT|nr:efflux RND transporter permease subunit [Ginsengibacter hankyongi]KAA9038640.1 efflux RND transporter permease subunit [Ginsengibacter hankyongi]